MRAFPALARRIASIAAAALLLASAGYAGALDDAGLDTGIVDAGSDATASDDSDAGDAGDAAPVWTSCIENVPSGAARPSMSESIPERALSGHAIPLRLKIEHGRGETVFPQGLHIQTGSETARVMAEQGFFTPSPDGGSGPQLSTRIAGDRSLTEVTLQYVALPSKPGRHELVLPPLPIAIARASGELVTLCTQPHRVIVDDPIASTPDAAPRGNPPARPQRELWTLARDLSYGLLIGAAAAALITWLVLRWIRRPRPPAPPPPPRPPWEVAFEELAGIRRAGLIANGQLTEHVDLVSDAVRRYLGARFGFDGIESTTGEVIRSLKKERPAVPGLDRITTLLDECDLVKFARLSPTATDCEELLGKAEQIVRDTMLTGMVRGPKPEPEPEPAPEPKPEPEPESSTSTPASSEKEEPR